MNLSVQHLSSFLLLAMVISVTPGPNNLMVLCSGACFGARQTLGHILGASAGSAIMLFLVGLGLHEAFSAFPIVQDVMKYAGAGYIFYLSWKIMRDSGHIQTGNAAHPMSFTGAALFQWINPKSWVMATVAISTCLPSVFSLSDIVLYTVLFAIISFPCVGIWAWFGEMIKRFLTNPSKVRCFNHGCAGLLVISALSMVFL